MKPALAIAPGVLLAGVAGGIALPLLPAIGLRMGMALPIIGAVLAANRVGRLIAGPWVGAAADRFGGRTLLLVGLAMQLAVMALYAAGVATHHEALGFLLGRLIHGPASACVLVAAQALALQSSEREQRGAAAGLVKASMSVGLPLGVLIGALCAGRVDELSLFGLSLLALLGALGLAFVCLPQVTVSVAKRAPLTEVLGNRRVLALGALNFGVTFSALGVVLTALSVNGRSVGLLAAMVVSMGLATLASSRWVKTAQGHARLCAVSVTAIGLALFGFTWGIPQTLAIAIVGLGAGALSASVVSLLSFELHADRVGAGSGWLQLCGDLGGLVIIPHNVCKD